VIQVLGGSGVWVRGSKTFDEEGLTREWVSAYSPTRRLKKRPPAETLEVVEPNGLIFEK
jgi:hypothetical protein